MQVPVPHEVAISLVFRRFLTSRLGQEERRCTNCLKFGLCIAA